MSEQVYWKNKWTSRSSLLPNAFAKKALRFLKNTRTKTILELGCGDGTDARYFARNGYHVTAIDFSESGIQKLRAYKEPHIIVRKADIRTVRLAPRSFDAIYAHLSLHYFDDKTTTRIFKKLHTSLKKGGYLFIKCKSTDDALYGVGTHVGQDIYKKGHIRHFFSKTYMAEKLNLFTIINIRKTSSTYHAYKSSFIEAIAQK